AGRQTAVRPLHVSDTSACAILSVHRTPYAEFSDCSTPANWAWLCTDTAAAKGQESGETMPSRDEHYTRAIAETALQQIKSLGLPADPVSYEVWYTYTAAHNLPLTQGMNELLSTGRRPSADDIDRLHGQFVAPTRNADRVEQVSSRIAEEVDQIVDLIEAATSSATAYRGTLEQVDETLGRATDRQTLRTIVQSL